MVKEGGEARGEEKSFAGLPVQIAYMYQATYAIYVSRGQTA